MNKKFTLGDAQKLVNMIVQEQNSPVSKNLEEYAKEYGYDLMSAKNIISRRLSELLKIMTPEDIFNEIEAIIQDFDSQEEKDSFVSEFKAMIENNDRARLWNIIRGYLKNTRKQI